MSRVRFVMAAVAAMVVGMGGALEAQEVEVSGNVSLATDYAFRGISQTLEEPAVQGGLDIGTAIGAYLGAWGSSVNFGEGPSDDRAQMELDVYGGFAPTFGAIELDIGALYYLYPGTEDSYDYNFWEAYAGAGTALGPVGVGVFGAWSPEFFGASGTGLFYSLDASAGIPDTPVSLDASIGMQNIEDNDAFGTPDYMTWSVGGSVDIYGLGVGAQVTGTDLDEADCFGTSDLCNTRFILSVGRGM